MSGLIWIQLGQNTYMVKLVKVRYFLSIPTSLSGPNKIFYVNWGVKKIQIFSSSNQGHWAKKKHLNSTWPQKLVISRVHSKRENLTFFIRNLPIMCLKMSPGIRKPPQNRATQLILLSVTHQNKVSTTTRIPL